MTDLQNTTKKTAAKNAPIFTFDESAYVAELIEAGLSPVTAVEVAANTARIRREVFEAGQIEQPRAAVDAVAPRPQQPEPHPLSDGNGTTSYAEMKAKPATDPVAAARAAVLAQENAQKEQDERDLTNDIFNTCFFKVEAPATKKSKAAKDAPVTRPIAVYDYRTGELPQRVRELIETHLAIEAEDAKSAGTLGFMTRSLAIATLPHRRIDDFRFVRKNGDFTLTMMTAHPEGLPFGTIPRLLLTWVCTEIAQKKERVLHLGDNLAAYLQELGLNNSGGKRGDITRLKHAMTTLFSSVISCHYDGRDNFSLNNVMLADDLNCWWTPQTENEAGKWQSTVKLSEKFFNECVEHKLPFDMRAIKPLRSSPLALDIYMWLTHRMSYLSRRTVIPWVALAGQFGASYASNEQGLRDFKRAFLRELKHVLIVYPAARCSESKNGLVLYPSPTHIAPATTPKQPQLPF